MTAGKARCEEQMKNHKEGKTNRNQRRKKIHRAVYNKSGWDFRKASFYTSRTRHHIRQWT